MDLDETGDEKVTQAENVVADETTVEHIDADTAKPDAAVPDSGDAATTERARGILKDPEKLKGRKIIVVDDEETPRILISTFAKMAGAEVLGEYNSAEDFLAAIESISIPPDATIVMDNTMRRLSGLACAESLRKMGLTGLKILIQSGDIDIDIFKQAEKSGIINGFLRKPWQQRELIEKIATL